MDEQRAILEFDKEDEYCPECGVSAEYRYCDNCPRAGYVVDCGHRAQPRPIATVGHKMLCDRCAKQKPLFPEQVNAPEHCPDCDA